MSAARGGRRGVTDHRGRGVLRRLASPFSEPGALVGLLPVTADVVYLSRRWRPTVAGLVLAGAGGSFAILSKEQYMPLAVPICIAMALASPPFGTSARA